MAKRVIYCTCVILDDIDSRPDHIGPGYGEIKQLLRNAFKHNAFKHTSGLASELEVINIQLGRTREEAAEQRRDRKKFAEQNKAEF